MAKTVVLVGHCGPDSAYLRMNISAARKEVRVLAADDEEALSRVLADEKPDLILFNRVLEHGFSEMKGSDVIGRLRGSHPELKMMLVSNFPEAQAEAVARGALPGFGKRELGTPRVREMIRAALDGTVDDKVTR